MPTLNFTSFHGAVPRCRYEVTTIGDTLYIAPDEARPARRYDPFEDADGLLLDVVRAGAQVAACDALFDYCLANKLLPINAPDFWRCGDFFIKRTPEAQPAVDAILAFTERYGLLPWDEQAPASALYPLRYERQMMAMRREGWQEWKHIILYETELRACRKIGAVPVCVLALTLLNFYLQFVEGADGGQFFIRNTEWMMAYGNKKTPELVAQVYDLTTCINLAYALLCSGEGKAVRQCKHCGKFFIADDLRAEYCSPRCRGAYNSKMTRKRVKERQARDEQQNNKGG